MPWERDHVLTKIESHAAREPPAVVIRRHSAVAVVLRFDAGPAEVLLMQRAEREGDRWSGQVSFPGGGQHAGETLLETAIRETREEVGVDLSAVARPIGRLDATMAMARGQVLPMAITPFVFVQEKPSEFLLGPEAAAAFWLPLGPASTGAYDDTFEYRMGPIPLQFGCWRYEGRAVWGLTFEMLKGLVRLVDGK